MQAPKVSKSGSVEASPRMSPATQTSQKSSPSSNRSARQLKVARPGSPSAASPNSLSRTPKTRSPKVLERGSPRSPMTELQKRRISKLSELEAQFAQLEDELKKAKEQLISSENVKRRAQQEAEETKKQLIVMSARLEESQQQLIEFSASEDSRVQELRKVSQERDKVWQSELEAIQRQHSMDSAALASALNEIQKLKRQLEKVADSEATQGWHAETAHAEIKNLRFELSETVALVESMRKQLNDCKGSEARAQQVARETQTQLQEAMTAVDNLRFEGFRAKEAYNDLASELKKSKEAASSLDTLVKELEKQLENRSKKSVDASGEIMAEQQDDGKDEEAAETLKLQAEINALRLEVGQLKSALEASEARYQEEYIQSTLQIRNAFEQVECAKSETAAKEAELESELKKARNTIDELTSELMSKETLVQNTSVNIKALSSKIEEIGTSPKTSDIKMELEKVKGDLQDLKAVLLDKETQIQHTVEENAILRAEKQARERDRNKVDEEAVASAEVAKAAEREALMKLGNATEEADKISMKAERVAEQLNAAQTANTELEAELRRLKVQSDQWRKAAEAAAAMISTGNNGKFADRTISFDSSYNTKMDSPLSDDIDDDSPKKKNGNMLKKFGVLWKKGPK